jgi:hypothetical protein
MEKEKTIPSFENYAGTNETLSQDDLMKMSEQVSREHQENKFAHMQETAKTEAALVDVRNELYAEPVSVNYETTSQEDVAAQPDSEDVPVAESPKAKGSFFRKLAAGAAFLGVFGAAGALEAKEPHKKESPVQKEDSFIVRADRTVGHVSGSFLNNVKEGTFNEVKSLVGTPVTISEAVMGRDFKKHVNIGPTERFAKAAGSVVNAGMVAGGIVTAGISTVAVEIGKGALENGVVKTTLDYNPDLLNNVKNKLTGNGNSPESVPGKKEVPRKSVAPRISAH